VTTLLFLILFLSPVLGFIVNGLNFRKSNGTIAGLIGTGAVLISFVTAIFLFMEMLGADNKVLNPTFYTWLEVGTFKATASFLMDPISGIMTLIITGVGSLIHIFSIGYMSHDERPFKYFAYLNLFIFNMLLLVLGDNLLVTFVGWEGVGLCSYLLIGFWFSDEKKAAAGMKAFITNRIGDAGLLIGIFILFTQLGTVNYSELNQYSTSYANQMGWFNPITLAMIFLFIGVCGKSAQIPLYVWLPDAMAGPTPVSALIHAATMVTAGVYLLIRLSPVLVLAPNAMMIISVVGALTALMGAVIGITQWDIKKILAYSTVSQLGYMILGVGVGAFIPAFFHLMTHAFFKALMFLGSGSVIHSMHEEQDIRKMGGLAKLMPITHLTFFIGWLAIIGLPPFSGFFSKDEILFYTFVSERSSYLLWFMGVVGAGCTAFYMTRLMCFTFWGESRVSDDVHPHESPFTMTFPLIILAVLAAFAGLLGIPKLIGEVLPGNPANILEHLLSPYVAKVKVAHVSHGLEWALIFVSVLVALVMAIISYLTYVKKRFNIDAFTQKIKFAYRLSLNKFYVDEFYFSKIINPLIMGSKALWLHIDVMFIDKFTYYVTDVILKGGSYNRKAQNGNFQNYVFFMSIGMAAFLIMIFAF
jgi:NADH-quinone oxidoreductase subunit L